MNLREFDLNLLVTLDALLREVSVTKAAKRLGLSTPAVSHALARLRTQLDDPLLVRAGRQMVLTPRAEQLRPKLRALLEQAEAVLRDDDSFDPGGLERSFLIHATDHLVMVLGPSLDAAMLEQAPKAVLRVLPNRVDDAELLRRGEIDLAVGVFTDLPPEMHMRKLFEDRFVVVARADHPFVGKRLSLQKYLAHAHVQISPQGRPGGRLDSVLAQQGHTRHIARTFPYFMSALVLVANSDYLLTVSERVAQSLAPKLGLKILPLPISIVPYAIRAIWHPRVHLESSHRWFRQVLAEQAAGL